MNHVGTRYSAQPSFTLASKMTVATNTTTTRAMAAEIHAALPAAHHLPPSLFLFLACSPAVLPSAGENRGATAPVYEELVE